MPQKKYSESYASCIFYDYNPVHISKILLLPPDSQHFAGEPRMSRTQAGKVVVYGTYARDMWCMSSKKWLESKKIATHINWLLEQLEPKAEDIYHILDQGATGRISCFVHGTASTPPSYPKALLQRADMLHLPIEIDYYEGV